MFRKTLVLITAVLASACGDSTAPSAPQNLQPPAVPATTPGSRVDLVGIVELDGPEGAMAYLRTETRLIPLYGNDVDLIRNVPGAEIRANGAWEAATGFFVQEFNVLTVRGRQVMDGFVIAMEDRLALRLSLTGTIVALADVPEALGAHIGARVWLAPKSDAAPAEFGIIAQ